MAEQREQDHEGVESYVDAAKVAAAELGKGIPDKALQAADPKEKGEDKALTEHIADFLRTLFGLPAAETEPTDSSVESETATVKTKGAQTEGKVNNLGGRRTISIGFSGGKPNFGLSLQGMISSANKMPAGSPQRNALEQKIEVVFDPALKARGSSAALQIKAGNDAISGGVSFGSQGVLNMSVAVNGLVINNAQDIGSSNEGPKPESYYTQKPNKALSISGVVGSGAFSAQTGASTGTTYTTTLGTNYNAPIIGISGTPGPYKEDVVIKKLMVAAGRSNPVVIRTVEDHGFYTGAQVSIIGVGGMTELNGNEYYVKIISETTFAVYTDENLSIPLDGTGFGLYTIGGIVRLGITYAAEQTLDGGYLSMKAGRGNYYDDEDKGTSYEEDVAGIIDTFEEEAVQDFADYGTDDMTSDEAEDASAGEAAEGDDDDDDDSDDDL